MDNLWLMVNSDPAWETYNKIWKVTMLSMGKSTILTGPWLPVRYVTNYQRVVKLDQLWELNTRLQDGAPSR